MSPSLWRHATGQRRARRSWRGQSLVEFALVVPVFFFLLAGAIDFGRLFYTYVGVTNAAREGAAYAAAAQINANSVTSSDRADPANIQFRARQELGGDAS